MLTIEKNPIATITYFEIDPKTNTYKLKDDTCKGQRSALVGNLTDDGITTYWAAGIICGKIFPTKKAGKLYAYASELSRLWNSLHIFVPASSKECDAYYQTCRADGLIKVFSREIGLPLFRFFFNLPGSLDQNYRACVQYEYETREIYAECEKQFTEGKKAKISESMLWSNNRVLCVDADRKTLYIASAHALHYNGKVLDLDPEFGIVHIIRCPSMNDAFKTISEMQKKEEESKQ